MNDMEEKSNCLDKNINLEKRIYIFISMTPFLKKKNCSSFPLNENKFLENLKISLRLNKKKVHEYFT